MTLPYDIARCSGANHQLYQTCRRREPGHPGRQPHTAPDIRCGHGGHFIPPVVKKEEKA